MATLMLDTHAIGRRRATRQATGRSVIGRDRWALALARHLARHLVRNRANRWATGVILTLRALSMVSNCILPFLDILLRFMCIYLYSFYCIVCGGFLEEENVLNRCQL